MGLRDAEEHKTPLDEAGADIESPICSKQSDSASASHVRERDHRSHQAKQGPAAAAAAGDGVSITMQGLCYAVVDTKSKRSINLLNDVSGAITPGQMYALMGPSGAGKTTLLDVIAGRKTIGTTSGSLLFDGHSRGSAFRKQVGYVEQFDTLMGTLTAYEMLFYTARLKLPPGQGRAAAAEKASELIKAFELDKCRDVKIGRPLERGISGGQAKRVNIAVELVNSPRLLFLDEPTSGLDSHTSVEVMRFVRDIALSGRTVITTIHQPGREIFEMFHKLVLLCSGSVIYLGDAVGVVTFYTPLGYHYSPKEWANPAEYIMDITSDQDKTAMFQEFYQDSDIRRENAREIQDVLQQARELDKPQLGDSKLAAESPWSYLHESMVLVERAFRGQYTDRQFAGARVAPRIIMSLVLASIWNGIGNNGSTDVTNRIALIFMIATFSIMIATLFVPSIIEDRPLFTREQNDGLYSVAAYFTSKTLNELPINIFACVLFFLVVYYAVDFDPSPSRAIFFVLMFVSNNLGGMSFATAVATLSPSAALASVFVPLVLLIFTLFSGFLILQDDIPDYWIWAHFLSVSKYAFGGFIVNEFSGREFSGCPSASGICFEDGDSVLEFYDVEDVDKWLFLLYNFLFFLGFSVVTYVSLVFVRHERR